MRAVIIGAGSIGMTTGALLTRGGCQVDLVDSYEANANALKEKGATICGTLDFTVPVSAYTPDEMTGIYDLAILLCKQTASKEALENLLPFLDENSTVMTLQNGIPEETVAEYVGWDRTVGGIVTFGATWKEPGLTECTTDTDHMLHKALYVIGEPSGKVTERIRNICEFMSHAGVCHITENLMGERWLKVMMNSTMSGMSACISGTFGDVLDSDDALTCAAHIADEAIKCCHAKGYRMDPIEGNDFEDIEMKDPSELEEKKAYIKKLWTQHRKLKASMLQDLEKGRKTEIDAINGQVCKTGRETGIKTPYNDMAVAVVKAAQENHITFAPEISLAFFKPLCDYLK